LSAQAGIWNFDGKPVNRQLLAGLNESLKQQGPDGDFCYTSGSLALLFRPFYTTAESRLEKQPYSSRRGFVVTWDGRLDNREELMAELSQEISPETTDVAIVAAAFDRWEIDCVRRLVGDWAVSIWNPQKRELVLAVDYMAIRHLFYSLKSDYILWSTSLTPLVLLSQNRFELDDNYIAGYFAHDPEGHLTPYRGIRQVPPGQIVRVRDHAISVTKYWHFSSDSRIRYAADAEYEEHFRHVFRQAVRRRLRCDSPVLSELSGGLDSSSIVCMADNIMAHEGAQTPRLDTLSYYDTTEPNGDDWVYFQKVEKQRARIGAHIDTSELGRSPAPLQSAEFNPLPGSLGMGEQLEHERAAVVRRGGHRAILSGIGGDEFLGGISNPNAQLADLIVQFRPVELAQQIMAWSLVKRKPGIHLLGQALVELLPPSVQQYLVKQARVEEWIDRDFAKRTHLAIRLLDVDDHFGFWLPTRRAYIAGVILTGYRLAKCMPPSLALEELRYPYLDRDLIEFILSIPANQLLRPGERRSLMRRSLLDIVPADILSRRTKQVGSRTPIVALERNWDEVERAFQSPLSSRLGYINDSRFLQRLHEARSGKNIHIVRMQRTISLEFWLRALASRGLIEDAPEPRLPRTPVPVETSA
jgi:asparagine synthase (glutamine-hydrolysing)